MGIQLDWEVESDAGNNAVAEDAAVIAAEKRRANFNRRALILLAIVLIIGGSIAAYRAKIVRDEKLRVLKLTVEAEALALRIGDKDKFMSLQGPADDWRTEQRAHFDQMVAQPDVEIDGKILSIEMTNLEARVILAMEVADQPTRAIWLYQYLDKGWKHTDTEEEPWMERTDVTGAFTFTYQSIDQPSVDSLRALLEEWWAIAAAEMRTDEPPTLTVTLDETASVMDWDSDDDNHLIIPPDAFENGVLKGAVRDRMGGLIAEYWAEYAIDDDRPDLSGSAWLINEVGLYLETKFGTKPPHANALIYLSTIFGDDLLPSFFALNRETGDPIESLRTAMGQNAPRQLTTEYFKTYLEAVLVLNTYNQSDVRVISTQPLVDARVYSGDILSIGALMLMSGSTGSIEIDDVYEYLGVYWITGTIDFDTTIFGDGSMAGTTMSTQFIVPFREMDGYYQISGIQPEDWGAAVWEETAYIRLEHSELDAPYFHQTVARYERDYLTAASMFGMVNTPQITIRVSQNMEGEEPTTDPLSPMIMSPHIICCFPGYDAGEFAHLFYIWQLYTAIINQQAGSLPDDGFAVMPAIQMMERAILLEAGDRQGYDLRVFNGGFMEPSVRLDTISMPTTLSDLWSRVGNDSQPYAYEIHQLGAEVLVEVLIDRYGQQAIAPLTQHVRHSQSIEEWLALSLGIAPQDVEAEWQQRYQQAVNETYGGG